MILLSNDKGGLTEKNGRILINGIQYLIGSFVKEVVLPFIRNHLHFKDANRSRNNSSRIAQASSL